MQDIYTGILNVSRGIGFMVVSLLQMPVLYYIVSARKLRFTAISDIKTELRMVWMLYLMFCRSTVKTLRYDGIECEGGAGCPAYSS